MVRNEEEIMNLWVTRQKKKKPLNKDFIGVTK